MSLKINLEDYHEYKDFELFHFEWYPIKKGLYPSENTPYLFCTRSGREFIGYMSYLDYKWDGETIREINFNIYTSRMSSKIVREKVVAFMLLPPKPEFIE